MIAARHSEVAENELREERQVEADKGDERGQFGPAFGIHASGDLRPPEMHSSQIGHDHAAHHYIMEVGNYEVGIVNMDVETEGRQEQAGQSADGEQADEAEGVEHGRFKGDRALVHGGGPVEYLDRRRYGDRVAEQREDHGRVGGDAGHEHVMRPDDKAENRDRDTGKRDEGVPKDPLARETGNDFADHAHARQNHDVYRRMRVEPKHVLEKHRIAAQFGIEDSDMEAALQHQQNQGNGQHRRSQDHDETSGVVGPYKQRQPAPGHAGGAHTVDGHDKVQPGKDGGKAGDQDSDTHYDHGRLQITGTQR